MRTVDELTQEIDDANSATEVSKILKEWAEEIIDQCATAYNPDDDGDSEVLQELKDQL